MKMIKDFCINFSLRRLAAAAALGSLCLLVSCKTTDRKIEGFGEEDKAGRHPGTPSTYKGVAFTMMIPPNIETNRKQSPKEIVHYFFTQEMKRRKVGMGIYEGVQAESLVRARRDLIKEDAQPATLDRFVGSQQTGVTYKGKRWREYFLFPQDGSNFALQIWYFDAEPEDEELFLQMISSIKAAFKSKSE